MKKYEEESTIKMDSDCARAFSKSIFNEEFEYDGFNAEEQEKVLESLTSIKRESLRFKYYDSSFGLCLEGMKALKNKISSQQRTLDHWCKQNKLLE